MLCSVFRFAGTIAVQQRSSSDHPCPAPHAFVCHGREQITSKADTRAQRGCIRIFFMSCTSTRVYVQAHGLYTESPCGAACTSLRVDAIRFMHRRSIARL